MRVLVCINFLCILSYIMYVYYVYCLLWYTY